jgi:hypothetical protein
MKEVCVGGYTREVQAVVCKRKAISTRVHRSMGRK